MTEPALEVETNALTVDPGVIAGENLDNTPLPEAVVEENLENPGEVEEAPKDHGNKGKTPWYMDRINEETNQKRLLQEQLTQERREKAEAKALLERMQNGDKEPAARVPKDEQDIEALIEARASQKLFDQDCNDVAAAGAREIPGFNEKISGLKTLGVLSGEFLRDILAVDKGSAHKILDALAEDHEQANLMVRMDSRQRIAKLTRLTMTEAKPAPVVRSGVSKVPPPKPIVEAISDGGGDMDLYNDKMDSATWSKIWDKKFLNRG